MVQYTKDISWKRPKTRSGYEVPLNELNKAIKNSRYKITFKAVVNDAMATLLSARCTNENAELGVVLGTGTNGSYFESINGAILPEKDAEGKKSIYCALNTEWGNFNSKSVKAYRDSFDRELDARSGKPGIYLAEKMLGGLYFQQYINIRFKAEAKDILSGGKEGTQSVEKAVESFSIKNEDLNGSGIDKAFEETFSKHLSEKERRTHSKELKARLKQIEEYASDRRKNILSAIIASIILKKIPERKNSNYTFYIGLNGSVCTLPNFISDIEKRVSDILKKIDALSTSKLDFQILLFYKEDASLIGAAYALHHYAQIK